MAVAQCHGDWIFSIDADEVPSPALVDALPSLMADPDVVQYEFPRRWLYPDETDVAGRTPLVARLPEPAGPRRTAGAPLRPPARPAAAVLPARHIPLPIYHLALVTAGEAERRRRSAHYEEHAPGRVAYGGGLLNATMYLPEDTATTTPRAVPAIDRPSIQTVLAARRQATVTTPPDVALPVVGRAEIDLHVQPTELVAEDYRATLSAYAEPGRMAPRELRPVYVEVRNDGTVPWPWGGTQDPSIALGYHWLDRDGAPMPDDGRRSPLTATLRPGASQIMPVVVEAPAATGRHVLEIDLVHDPVRWFRSPLTLDMLVEPAAHRPAPAPSSTMLVTTIVARNYVPRARLLARSFLQHHPRGRVAVLVIDADEEDHWDEAFEVLRLEDLPMATRELHRMATIYDVTELATAVKPFLLRHLLIDRGEPSVTYLDPDIEVFGPFDDLDALARAEEIVLTPHRLEPCPTTGCQPDERSLHASGGVQPRVHRRRPRGRRVPRAMVGALPARTASSPMTKVFSSTSGGSTPGWGRSGTTSSAIQGATSRTGTSTRGPITAGPDGYAADGGRCGSSISAASIPSASPPAELAPGDAPAPVALGAPGAGDLFDGYAPTAARQAGRRGQARVRWARTGGGIGLDRMMRRIVARRGAAPRA